MFLTAALCLVARSLGTLRQKLEFQITGTLASGVQLPNNTIPQAHTPGCVGRNGNRRPEDSARQLIFGRPTLPSPNTLSLWSAS